jgi:malonyl-CoA decarboxylase
MATSRSSRGAPALVALRARLLKNVCRHPAWAGIETRVADGLRRRLQDDRRCYALFSAALPDQPLVFIELALTPGL